MTISKELLQKYFNNQATSQEVKEVLPWFEAEEGQVYLNEQLNKDFENLDNTPLLIGQLESEKILKRVMRQAKPTQWRYRMAASVALLIVLMSIWSWSKNRVEEYATVFGEQKTIVLPDHSVVILNSNSKLNRKKSVWGWPREVWISGEAFFDIAHAANKQFVVHTESVNVVVVGTQFNVNARGDQTKVSLERGKVKLFIEELGNRMEVEMNPGELVEYDKKTSYLLKKEKENIEKLSSWKEGKLYFDQSTVREIALLLEFNYGLELIIDDPQVLEQRITGTLPNNNIEAFLLGLAEICQVNIRKENNLIYVSRK